MRRRRIPTIFHSTGGWATGPAKCPQSWPGTLTLLKKPRLPIKWVGLLLGWPIRAWLSSLFGVGLLLHPSFVVLSGGVHRGVRMILAAGGGNKGGRRGILGPPLLSKTEHSTCGFFKWVDDIRELQYQNVDKNSIIMELEDKIELLKEKVRKLKAKQEKLVDQVEEMGMATTETLFEMKENNTDKKLMLTLIFTLGIFHCSVVDEVQVVVLGCSTRLQC
uniref:Uncharacterized protein n=1 Tax=Chenopodium quinoa TaxID=63459 RepID=A0A803NEX8_CHEQI